MWISIKQRQGFSLLGAVVSIVIVGVSTATMTRAYRGMQKVNDQLDNRQHAEDLRQYLRERLSCTHTFAGIRNVCSKGAVAARQKDGSVLTRVQGTDIGSYTLKSLRDRRDIIFRYKDSSGRWHDFMSPITCPSSDVFYLGMNFPTLDPGDEFTDESASCVKGRFFGTPGIRDRIVPGLRGKALRFDGAGDHISFDHSEMLQIQNGSFSILFKPTSVYNRRVLANKDHYSSSPESSSHFRLEIQANNTISVRLQDDANGQYFVTSRSIVRSNEWNYVVVNFGNGGMKLFLNGRLESTNPAWQGGLNASGCWQDCAGNREPLVIGAGNWHNSVNLPGTGRGDPLNQTVHHHFQGLIDEVGFHSHQMSEREVATRYRDIINLSH